MFNELGDSVLFNQEVINFKEIIRWSKRFLCKDDRIVWYLSVVRRLAFLLLQESDQKLTRKLLRKISRKLKGWTKSRVHSDYQCFTRKKWEHFVGFNEAFNCQQVNTYSFWKQVRGKSIPLPSSEIIEDFEKMEDEVMSSSKNQRFCREGVPFLETVDDWGWYIIENGFSVEEARAMNHCGNVSGKKGDKLLSLRESFKTPLGTFLKPHLTFILNGGYLYEMKGFANQKADKKYHSHIEKLLLCEQVKGLRGGGYLPKNNFNFFDLNESSCAKIVKQKPSLTYDFFGNGGVKLKEVPGVGDWFFYGRSDCKDEVMSRYGLNLNVNEPSWLVLQADNEFKRSLAWCSFEDGKVGKLHIEKDISSLAFSMLLQLPEVLSIDEPLLNEESSWDPFLDYSEIERTLNKKPGFFRKTSLDAIFNLVGTSEGFLRVVNDQIGLDTRFCLDGIKLISFRNIYSFARRTGINSIIRKVKEFDSRLEILKRDIFKLGWLTLRSEKDGNNQLFLHIQNSEIMHFFSTLKILGKTTPKELIQRMIFHYGPPDLFEKQLIKVEY